MLLWLVEFHHLCCRPAPVLSSLYLIGLGNGHLYPAFLNMFINVARHNQRGTANGGACSGWDLGFGIGCLLGGVVAEHFSYERNILNRCDRKCSFCSPLLCRFETILL